MVNSLKDKKKIKTSGFKTYQIFSLYTLTYLNCTNKCIFATN